MNRAHDIRVGLSEAHAACGLIQRGVGDDVLKDLAIETELACLLHGQRPAEAAADLLHPVSKQVSELLGGDLGVADLGERRLSESLEDVGDTPDTETDDQHAEQDGHDRLAEPIR